MATDRFKIKIKREEPTVDPVQLWKYDNTDYIVSTLNLTDPAVVVSQYSLYKCCSSNHSNEFIMENGKRVTNPVSITLMFNY